MSKKSKSLLPCPFCGSEAAPKIITYAESFPAGHTDINPGYFVICDASGEHVLSGCGGRSGYADKKKAVRALWNTRQAVLIKVDEPSCHAPVLL